jgi:hypothetical protein
MRLDEDREKQRDLVTSVIKLQVPYHAGSFLKGYGISSVF